MGTRHYFEKKGTREISRFTSQLTLKSVPHIYTFRLMDVFLFWGVGGFSLVILALFYIVKADVSLNCLYLQLLKTCSR